MRPKRIATAPASITRLPPCLPPTAPTPPAHRHCLLSPFIHSYLTALSQVFFLGGLLLTNQKAGRLRSPAFVVVQSLSRVRLFAAPWTTAHEALLSSTFHQGLLKLMSIESVMPPNHLILCCPLLCLPSILPSIRVFSNESALHIR